MTERRPGLRPWAIWAGFGTAGPPAAKSVWWFCSQPGTRNEGDWPDQLDLQTGFFTYYGDDRKPVQPDLHDGPRSTNVPRCDAFGATRVRGRALESADREAATGCSVCLQTQPGFRIISSCQDRYSQPEAPAVPDS
ncbi:hypothetical protein [Nocardia wallacei]|uniref:hypothetical protein n=1 Tax=Nocardia wallacei TaxID=480035 RepID=UPI003CC7D17A